MNNLTLFLSGDVMTGRGIDQILPNPGDPTLHERSINNARRYVDLAERAYGTIPSKVDFTYPWGIALEELKQRSVDVRIINLETSVTTSNDSDRDKGIHYRMNPENVSVLTEAGIDVCVLSNNHVLDWGREGLAETLDTLREAGVQTAGAGYSRSEAREPATVQTGKGRILVIGLATRDCGVPHDWSAKDDRSGVNLLDSLSRRSAEAISDRVASFKEPGDIAILSIHWGSNWGYEIPDEHRRFARTLIGQGSIDLVHGHSSHHVKPLEVYNDGLILYGCGDFLTDYEGITGHEQYRDDLGLMYLPTVDTDTGNLEELTMVPTKLRKFQLTDPDVDEIQWLKEALTKSDFYVPKIEMMENKYLELRLRE